MSRDEPKRPPGRPLKHATPARTTLGGVRITDEQDASYRAAAERVGKSRTDWIRDVLDRAAARALRK